MEPDVNSSQGNRPLWNYVTKIGKCARGGNVSFICNYCQMKYMGSYSRVKAHLLRISGKGIRPCSSVNVSEIAELQRLEEEASKRMENVTRDLVPLPAPNSSQASSSPTCTPFIAPVAMRLPSPERQGSEYKKRKVSNQLTIDEMFESTRNREELDMELARMFYSGGLPFNFARCEEYKDAMSFLASKRFPGYTPPNYIALKTTLLKKEKARIGNLLESIKCTWEKKGVTIVADGWTDPHRCPLINFMATNDSGTMFLRSVICKEATKDDMLISQLMKEVIHSVGFSNVIQIITDNDSICKRSGQVIEDAFPRIFWTPCVVHTLDLALKSIFAATESDEVAFKECYWISDMMTTVTTIKKFIINHSRMLEIFNNFPVLKVFFIAETRFASAFVALKRFKSLSDALRSMVIDDQWSSWCDEKNDGALVKARVLDNSLWSSIDYILAFTKPIYDMMRACNTDEPSLHLVYVLWDSMMMNVKETIYFHEMKIREDESSLWNAVSKILNQRRAESITPLHAVAHSLNPRCTTREWMEEHPNLLPPESDPTVSSLRQQFLQRYFLNDNLRTEVKQEFTKFMGCLQEFGDRESLTDRTFLSPIEWWYIHGYLAPNLQQLSLRLLGHTSSSACQRNWSTYSFIHTARREYLEYAEDLVYVHTNLRLLSRKTKEYIEGDSKMWDVSGDGLESLDGIGILKTACLSLDEPEFELACLSLDEED